MSWSTRDGLTDSVTLTSQGALTGGEGPAPPEEATFSNNQWYTVDLKYLLGSISLKVESGSRVLAETVVSNSTFRRYLWDLDLTGAASGLVVGAGFTGCIEEGAGVRFTGPLIQALGVRWGQCPLEAPTVRGCGEYSLILSFI